MTAMTVQLAAVIGKAFPGTKARGAKGAICIITNITLGKELNILNQVTMYSA